MTTKFPITTVVFDFDGTLAATLEGIYACVCETLSRFGYAKPSLSEVRSTIGIPLEDGLQRLTAAQRNDSSFHKLVKVYRAVHYERAGPLTTLFRGTLETLSALRSMHMQMILVSNKSGSGLRRQIKQFGIDQYMDIVLGVDDTSFRKPDGRLFEQNFAPHLAAPGGSQVLMVGDTELDILFAKNAGLRSCWASYGYGDEDACKALAPDFILPDITELPALISAINPPANGETVESTPSALWGAKSQFTIIRYS